MDVITVAIMALGLGVALNGINHLITINRIAKLERIISEYEAQR